jgi:hypothetical protein
MRMFADRNQPCARKLESFLIDSYVLCFLVYSIPLTSHYPLGRAILSRARHILTIGILKTGGEDLLRCAFGATYHPISL